jgi:hypothetical protein
MRQYNYHLLEKKANPHVTTPSKKSRVVISFAKNEAKNRAVI